MSALAVAAPAVAADYPPGNSGQTKVVITGVLVGGPSAAAEKLTGHFPPASDNAHVPAQAAANRPVLFSLNCGDGTHLAVVIHAPSGTANAGSFNCVQTTTYGPVRFTKPGHYSVTFSSDGQASAMNLGGGRLSAGVHMASNGESLTYDFTVKGAASASAPADQLSHTGGNGLGAIWLGAGLIAVGGGFVVMTSRKARSAS
ncbi:MAG: hypothetical protein ACTHK1_07055 [Actinomycetales bacterium]